MTKYISSVGRRKEASVRVRLIKASGDHLVNGKVFSNYFPGKLAKLHLEKPFKLTNTLGKYYFTAITSGGGKIAQLQALVSGIAKALVKVEKANYRPSLKKAGLLTRDARIRERRKVNTGGKARRAKQSPKR